MSRPGLRGVVFRVVFFTALSGLLTSIVITSLLDSNVHAASGYHAEFTNASGLEAGDTVRIAGVEVGKVGAVTLHGDHAQVSFSVTNGEHLTTNTTATIHFANLLGQRFLALLQGAPGGTPLPAGGDIPLTQTTPALDLTAVFNGFEPLFSALQPNQVNELAASIIQVFQGESGTISGLVQQTAVITNNLADRQQVIDGLLTNLASLLNTVGAHANNLGTLISSFETLMKGLAGSTGDIGGAIDNVGNLNSQVSGLLNQADGGVAPGTLDRDISGLQQATAQIAADQGALNGVLQGFPGLVSTLTKIQSSGNYLNVYLCNLTLNVSGPLDVSLIPGVPAPQFGDPVSLPSGPIGDQTKHTAACA